MNRRAANLLLIVARRPEPGAAKTRLGAVVGMAAAASLYRAFLADLAARYAPGPGVDFGWAFCPASCDFRKLLIGLTGRQPAAGTRFVAQTGDSLNDRLTNLFRWAVEHGYERTAIMASDSPQLRIEEVVPVFGLLERHDVALGRVHDGGYYLIGQRGVRDLLSDLPMSAADAADAVVERARQLGLTTGELPPTFDVDVVDDLAALRESLRERGGDLAATGAALAALDRAAAGAVACPGFPDAVR